MVIIALLYATYLLILMEVASRAYLNIRHDVPFFEPETIIYNFYPELRELKKKDIHRNDGYFDILVLGASVLHPNWGYIEQILSEELSQKTQGNFRIHNLSRSAHSSLDSYHKYKRLMEKSFDLVVFYHGINEVRANNCPDFVFRSDYSHYIWYRRINIIDKHGEMKFVAFPYVFDHALMVLREGRISYKLTHPQLVRGRLSKGWIECGSTIKTRSSFERNLRRIVQIAKDKEEPLLLMSFAFYVPKDYTLERFTNKSLDYNEYKCSIEVWGKPENVVKGILNHNQVIEDIVKENKDIYFVDMNRLIPKQGRCFDDICHLTYEGSREFVNNIFGVAIDLYHSYEDRNIGQ